MPTGYTSGIYDGKTNTLREFALECVRAFAPLVEMKDAPYDAVIPQKLEPQIDFYEKKLTELRQESVRVTSLSEEECLAESAEEAKVDDEFRQKYLSDVEERRERYDLMMDKVRNWKAGPDDLKSFMLEQLNLSKDCDCPPEPLKYHEIVTKLPANTWRTKKLNRLDKEIEYYEEQIKKIVDITNKRNEWLDEFWEALNGVDE